MITGLDHIALAVRDIDATVEIYRNLLGAEPHLQDGGGARRAWFRFPNMALEVIAPDGDGPAGNRLRAQLNAHGDGLWIVAFAVRDLAGTVKLVERRGLRIAEQTAEAALIDQGVTGGLQIALVNGEAGHSHLYGDAAIVAGLDHVVIQTPNPDRALAIYGAKLGLDLRLDRSNEGWGVRQLFFKAGEAVVEFGASLKRPVTDQPDSFGGLAWRVRDPQSARSRLAAAGFNVSELRGGRKPGTSVFTVRDAPAGVPTLMLSAEPQPETA